MWLRWFPWRYVVRRLARRHGFLDPLTLLSYMRRFAQPSEVAEPIELLRAGMVFHARGLMNSRAIQQNLDWVWPYWIERQFNPRDPAFIPRAFSLTHINLTHRNWTAIGVPDHPELPIVDPRGLLTPLFDGWSVDAWVVDEAGQLLAPSQVEAAEQTFQLDPCPTVVTRSVRDELELVSKSWMEVLPDGKTDCRLAISARARRPGWLVVALRPYNPEGIRFVHEVMLNPARDAWTIDDQAQVRFDRAADRHLASEYHSGDTSHHLLSKAESDSVVCNVGMATAAALFALDSRHSREVEITIPIPGNSEPSSRARGSAAEQWRMALDGSCRLAIPDERWQFLYDAAIHTMVLHSPETVWPGPYTYKRFWFRDAAFILHAMLSAGLIERAQRVIEQFPPLQTPLGYFHSQEGEWDANGQVLWIVDLFQELTGRTLNDAMLHAIEKGARWIARKRTSAKVDAPHAGLLPAGFSAEHLGPNDYYYWDDIWSVAGLRAASRLMLRLGFAEKSGEFAGEAANLMVTIEKCLQRDQIRLGRLAIPASPYRRLDSGAIGSVAADYPAQLWPAGDPRMMDTLEHLLANCMLRGGFFQDMIHSGINAYLTLHIAQVLLRAGDPRHEALIETVADLASPTGQWPEAIHPHTGGGCMGDGQHVWAAAEWVMMLRNCLVREEISPARLILGSGLRAHWLDAGSEVRIGPTPTRWGPLTARFQLRDGALEACWQGRWREAPPEIEVRAPGWRSHLVAPGECGVKLERI